MICPKCKTKNLDNSRFCGICRHPLVVKVSHSTDIAIAMIAYIVIVATVQVFATTLIALLEIAINYQLANGESELLGSITQAGTAEGRRHRRRAGRKHQASESAGPVHDLPGSTGRDHFRQ